MSARILFVALAFATACNSTTANGASAETKSAAKPGTQPATQPSAPAAVPASASEKFGPATSVAKIGDEVITGADLDQSLKLELQRANRDYGEKQYQIRKNGLEAMIRKQLVEAKAKAANTTPAALMKKEVTDKITEPTDKEIQSTYDEAKAGGRQLPPIEQVRGQIVQFLKSQRARTVTEGFYNNLKQEAKVAITFPEYEPIRMEIPTEGPSKGPADAPITIVEFSDFECPFCSKAETVVSEVMAQYKDKVRVVFRDYPLPFHEQAQKASEAALCAEDQGKYWEMHDKLFANQKKLGVPELKGYAKELGLKSSKFDKCLDSDEKAEKVAESKRIGEALGVDGTPAFFINGLMLTGAQPIEAFKKIIDAELVAKK